MVEISCLVKKNQLVFAYDFLAKIRVVGVRLKFWALLLLLVLNGCRVGPRYETPLTEVSEKWKSPHEENVSPPLVEYWWEVFQDPILNDLEKRAVAGNPSLYVALEKILEARALIGVESANLSPQIYLNPSFTDSTSLFQAQLPGNLLSGAGAAGGASIPPYRVHQFQYLLPINLNWEIDLWGRLRSRVDAASFNAEAEAEAYCGAMLSLTTDLAASYFQLRMLDAEILFLESTLKTRAKNYELTQSRYDKGLVNYLDVTQASVDLANVKANLDESVRLRSIAENQIAVLCGALPMDFHLEPNPLESPPPTIPAGVPSTVLLRRPDIAQAERKMAQQNAEIGVAYASFFPALSLTGAIGYLSPDINQFLKWISRYWMVGAEASQMVYDGGRDASYLQAAYARFNQASGSYQQQVLIAFQEVENALKSIQQYAMQSKHLSEAVKASTRATKLSKSRYLQGVSIYLEVIENERLELQAKINWIHTLNFQYLSTIQLIKSIGGSWL